MGQASGLALARKKNEDVAISGPCVIKVIDCGRDSTRLLFIAPKSTHIYRTEVLERMKRTDPEVASQFWQAMCDHEILVFRNEVKSPDGATVDCTKVFSCKCVKCDLEFPLVDPKNFEQGGPDVSEGD